MTEDQAKTKWCPMVRERPFAIERFHAQQNGIDRCIGAACMMWRWEHPMWEKNTEVHNKYVTPEGEGWEWVEPSGALAVWMGTEFGWYRKRGEGHCGLAGKP